jgi:tetratricopeptide (TPR) repeat protein
VYSPNPNPHINEWHKHNPPPGTVYNVHPRLNHPSLVNRADTVQRLEGLLEKAPYENSVRNYLYKAKYRQKPTYDQAVALYRPILDYSSGAMAMVAYATEDNPARYEEWMLKAAAVNPDYYFTLATFFSQRDETKAIGYFEKAVAAGGNSIRASTFASWAVRYYLAKGQTEKARQVADEAGEVYSGGGLAAKAEFLEATGKYAEAFEWYAKMEERYGQSGLLMRFCSRYKEKTGDGRFDAELQKRLRQLFSGDPKKVRLADLKGAPTDGVIVEEVNGLTEEAGLKGGDIIVAAQGIRVHTFEQYDYARDSSASPELVLLVWQDGAYREIKASPPNHRFGADFATYRRK